MISNVFEGLLEILHGLCGVFDNNLGSTDNVDEPELVGITGNDMHVQVGKARPRELANVVSYVVTAGRIEGIKNIKALAKKQLHLEFQKIAESSETMSTGQ